MSGFVRRVVTGHDKQGKAIVLSDGIAPMVHQNAFVAGYKTSDIWKTTAMPAPISREEPDAISGPRSFVDPMGTKIRISEIPPETEATRQITVEQARQMFSKSGKNLTSTYEEGGRHPMMHRTETIDYAVVLEGEITLLLDEEDVVLRAGDVVIQRGTNHAWSNRSGKNVRILYLLVDGRFDDEMAALFKPAQSNKEE